MLLRGLITTILAALFLVTNVAGVTPADSSMSDASYENGVKAVQNGEISKALQIWKEAQMQISSSGKADPRIGFSYIRYATENEMRDHYKTASELYYWSLAHDISEEYIKEIRNEIDRLKVLAEPDLYKEWKKQLKDRELNKLGRSIVKFWKRVDPTLDTSFNERLIEHWERIAYCRKNFNINRATIYDADERSNIYVKLGDPDYIKKGTIFLDKPLVRSWIRDAFLANGVNDSVTFGFSSSQFSTAQNNTNSEDAPPPTYSLVDAITRDASFLINYPQYEIWVYNNLINDNTENAVYIFGEDGDTKKFRMLSSLEELLPSRAFRTATSRAGAFTPGLFLQLLVYSKTSSVDPFFAERFSEMESRLFTASGVHKSTGFMNTMRSEFKLENIHRKAPQEKSTKLENLPTIRLEASQYRLLSPEDEPYLATFVSGSLDNALVYDYLVDSERNLGNYSIRHSAMGVGEDEEILFVDHKSDNTDLKTSSYFQVLENQFGNYFLIPHTSEDTEQIFTAELLNERKDSSKIDERGFTENLRALGRISSFQPEPLSTDPSDLEMSDLILGVDGDKISSNDLTTFKVVHDNTIEERQNLFVHFEVYHLEQSVSGVQKFTVDYVVKKKGQGFFKKLFGGDEKVGLTLNFETDEMNYRGDLEIDTSPFKPGSYTLSLSAREPDTDREVQRTVDFDIVAEQ